MTALLVLAIVHLVVPVAFIAWQWCGDVSSRAQWLVRTATEPHLHIHAQRNGIPDRFLDGEPVPMRIGGKFLARNDRVSR